LATLHSENELLAFLLELCTNNWQFIIKLIKIKIFSYTYFTVILYMKILRYKGKFIIKEQYNKKVKQTEVDKQRALKHTTETRVCLVKGNRCWYICYSTAFITFCKEILSFEDIEKETVKRLTSIFNIWKMFIYGSSTDNQHKKITRNSISVFFLWSYFLL